jgi:hypothetical protein
VAIFVVSWLVSFGYWQYKQFDKTVPFNQIQQSSINAKT